jgi:hypothetical protein
VKHAEFAKPLQRHHLYEIHVVSDSEFVVVFWSKVRTSTGVGSMNMVLCCIFRVLIETDLAIGASPV